jgi:uncharacterized HAD superfamily protein/hypoxanthine phosphoribosyltransferase
VKIAWRTFADLTAVCRDHLADVRKLSPDVIVGIPRSGMVPASILATSLGLPLADLHTFCDGREWGVGGTIAGSPVSRVLLVDDASGYGRTMTRAIERLAAERPDAVVMPCSVYADPEAAPRFALAMERLAKPRLFEWNWWRSGKLAHCCVDIDGVICRDPTSAEKGDPDAYREFIASTPLLYRPAKPVGAFVTGRSSNYRAETEAYFKRHGIAYGALAMREGDRLTKTVEAHAEHKAAFYRKSDAVLFIESDERQAEMIARTARKPALCIETGKVY